jgi:lipoprotein-releasing system permease protein
MYHALLTNRYLTSRVIPLIAVAAVALCVALVIIVVSVMTGFLDMVKNSGRTLMGDVVISYPVKGIPYYERLIARITQLPEAAAATPVIDGLGLLRMPYPDEPEKSSEMVQFWGIEPESFAAVTGYEQSLYWRSLNQEQWEFLFSDVLTVRWEEVLEWLTEDQRVELLRRAMLSESGDPSLEPDAQRLRAGINAISKDAWQNILLSMRRQSDVFKSVLTTDQWRDLLASDPRLVDAEQVLKDGLALTHAGDPHAIVLGMHVSEGNERQRDGTYRALRNWHWWMPRYQVTLTTLPVTGGSIGGADSAENRVLKVVNEFVSGVFVIDDKRVMIPLKIAQEMTHLNESKRVREGDDPFVPTGIDPARATMVLVRAAPGVTPEQLREKVANAYDQFAQEIAADPDSVLPPALGFGLSVQTWAQQQASFIGPVEKEREMMRTLFSLVYLVCAGLVLAIFWAIVYEKTRDIGILRSIGASRIGISWIFLRYGMLIGVAGAIVGLGLAYLVVSNINVIHEALGNPPLWLALSVLGLAALALVITIIRSLSGNLLPVVVGSLVTLVLVVIGGLALWLWKIGGVIIWNPEVYYFTQIPNKVDMNSAYITMIGAVFFSLIGAFVPAAKAADTDPVKALRYE